MKPFGHSSSQGVEVREQDSHSVDASGRHRVSNPETIFDSKQTLDKAPLFWDELLESGDDIASVHSTDTASSVITSTVNTAGVFIRQSFMWFNYQPSKGAKIKLSAVLQRSGGGVGVRREVGYFNDDNGLFFVDIAGVMNVVRRSSVTGSPVDETVPQTLWGIDKMDGSGPSGLDVDFSKIHIYGIDFEWLSGGRVRMFLRISGANWTVHEFLAANELDKAFMSTPNLPIRYRMETTGSSPAATMESVCATVISEGGKNDLGLLRYISTEGTHVDATTENVLYALVGIRLKAAAVSATIKVIKATIAEHAGSIEYEWLLVMNPDVAGTFTYVDIANSALQAVKGATANVVTNGTLVTDGGFGSSAQKGGTTISEEAESAIRLGSAINGDLDTLVLCVRQIAGTSGGDFEGGVLVREIS